MIGSLPHMEAALYQALVPFGVAFVAGITVFLVCVWLLGRALRKGIR